MTVEITEQRNSGKYLIFRVRVSPAEIHEEVCMYIKTEGNNVEYKTVAQMKRDSWKAYNRFS